MSLSGFECWPVNWRGRQFDSGQGTCLGCGPGPWLGAWQRQLTDVSLVLQCFSPFLSLSLFLPSLPFIYFSIMIFLIKHFFYCCSITVVCIFLPTPAKPISLPRLHPPPWFCQCVLYSSSWKPLSPLSPPHSPMVIVRLLLTSMSLVTFCLLFSFVD